MTNTQKVRFMSEYDQPAGPGPATSPQQQRDPGRVSVARTVITSRGAGWAVAAILAGAVTALSILLAAGPSADGVVQVPVGAGPLGPARIAKIAGPGGPAFRIAPAMGPGRRVIFAGPGAAYAIAGPGFPGQVLFPGPGFPPGAVRAQLGSPFGQVVAGTVASVSGSTFTVTGPPGGQTFTVREQSSTSYRKSGSPAAASAVTKGAHVAVLGSLSGTTMTAAVVAVLP